MEITDKESHNFEQSEVLAIGKELVNLQYWILKFGEEH